MWSGVDLLPMGAPLRREQDSRIRRPSPSSSSCACGAKRELDLPVRQDVRYPESPCRTSRQRVRLALGHEAHEDPLDDDEDADGRVVPPGLAVHPLVERPFERRIALGQHLAHAHRPCEATRVVDVQADGVTLSDASCRRLLGERDEELLPEAPSRRTRRWPWTRSRTGRRPRRGEARARYRRERAVFGIESDEHFERVGLSRACWHAPRRARRMVSPRSPMSASRNAPGPTKRQIGERDDSTEQGVEGHRRHRARSTSARASARPAGSGPRRASRGLRRPSGSSPHRSGGEVGPLFVGHDQGSCCANAPSRIASPTRLAQRRLARRHAILDRSSDGRMPAPR